MALRILNSTKNEVLATCAELADTEHKRMRGLLDKVSLAPGEALFIPNCGSIHTVGMRFPIDVLYLDHQGKVVGWRRQLMPGSREIESNAHSVLELPSGMAQSTEIGDQLIFHRL